jgi:hypothetical protein
MNETLSVEPGVDMSQALGPHAKLTKKWLREYLRANPEKDFRILSGRWRGSYVNGEDCIREDVTLDVVDPHYYHEHVAFVNFQHCDRTQSNLWGYQAVVR